MRSPATLPTPCPACPAAASPRTIDAHLLYVLGGGSEGGFFAAELEFPKDYPNAPPTMKFSSKMWHPNIYSDGRVCISYASPWRACCEGMGCSACWLCRQHTVPTSRGTPLLAPAAASCIPRAMTRMGTSRRASGGCQSTRWSRS